MRKGHVHAKCSSVQQFIFVDFIKRLSVFMLCKYDLSLGFLQDLERMSRRLICLWVRNSRLVRFLLDASTCAL